jgi:hypothetical protein
MILKNCQFLVRALFFLLCSAVFSHTAVARITENQNQIVTGVVLLNEKKAPDAKVLVAALKKDWKLSPDSVSHSDKTTVFSVPGAVVMIAWLDYPPPAPEVRAAARISWLWPNAETEALNTRSQLVISVVGNNAQSLNLHKIFTKIAGAALELFPSNGTYMGDRFLLLSKGFYVSAAKNALDDTALPVYCWVYFGIQQREGLSGGYTYGLQEFGQKEIEISGSQNSMQEVHAMLYDVTAFVVQWNYTLKSGTVFDGIPDAKLPVLVSPAVFIDGETVKLTY